MGKTAGCKHRRPRRCRKKPLKPKKRCIPRRRVCRRGKDGNCCQSFRSIEYEEAATSDEFVPMPKQDTSSDLVLSYSVLNRGGNAAVVRLEVGPNGVDFASDYESVVEPGGMIIMTPSRFLHFTRLSIRSQQPGASTLIQVYFQAQRTQMTSVHEFHFLRENR
ncbi:DUF6385 domain-containing protein [Paenibacillus sp. JDR-2]|uniref:DUF6385 domain-containing protein n=1 Tax=Paenibacillus sp. (strain JDR-2) TaxID=324057 RepID=UPI000166869D|nr:DUF6385 domain-containing protein [Paenibacillus sp. JDR-2]ACT04483.1 hypothetical protein Pjdr2_5879 [Paenibacillus sp. JDR-2]